MKEMMKMNNIEVLRKVRSDKSIHRGALLINEINELYLKGDKYSLIRARRLKKFLKGIKDYTEKVDLMIHRANIIRRG